MGLERAAHVQASSGRANSVGLPPAVLDAVLNRLDARETPTKAKHARSSFRVPFRRLTVAVDLIHANGTKATIRTACRNISARGVGVLHGSFIHSHTKCKVLLPHPARGLVSIRGEVVRCEHLAGVVHEVGIRLDEEIDPREYIKVDAIEAHALLERLKPSELTGDVLLVMEKDESRRAFRRLLGSTKVNVCEIRTLRDPLPSGFVPKALVCELPPEEMDSNEAILRIATLSNGAPFLVVAPNDSLGALQRGEALDPVLKLIEPLTEDAVIKGLGELLILNAS
jgi:hypothetical protein